MGSFLCRTEERAWLFLPPSYQEGPEGKHCSREGDVQSAFIFCVEGAVCLSQGHLHTRANLIKRLRNKILVCSVANSVLLAIKIIATFLWRGHFSIHVANNWHSSLIEKDLKILPVLQPFWSGDKNDQVVEVVICGSLNQSNTNLWLCREMKMENSLKVMSQEIPITHSQLFIFRGMNTLSTEQDSQFLNQFWNKNFWSLQGIFTELLCKPVIQMCRKQKEMKCCIYNLRLGWVLGRMSSFSWAAKGRNTDLSLVCS